MEDYKEVWVEGELKEGLEDFVSELRWDAFYDRWVSLLISRPRLARLIYLHLDCLYPSILRDITGLVGMHVGETS
jgi:hypothetical protein